MSLNFDNIPDSAYEDAVRSLFGDRAIKETSDHFEFVCPVCGDMARPNKKKAYIYKDKWRYICYKCGESLPFMSWLKENASEEYSRLLFYAIEDSGSPSAGPKRIDPPREIVPKGLPFVEGDLLPMTATYNPLVASALNLCRERRIREEIYSLWFVCIRGEYWGRIIIPFYKFGGSWNQFDARAIDPNNPLRYYNYRGNKREAYNVDFVDYSRTFYILEGTIDSTFIRNSVAIGGIQHLGEILRDNPEMEKHKNNAVLLWDNDTAGRKATIDNVSRQFRWFDWTGISAKDINGAVLSGEIPVDMDGFVNRGFLEGRTRSSDMADIIMTMQFGNIRKQAYIDKMETRKKLQSKQKDELPLLFLG